MEKGRRPNPLVKRTKNGEEYMELNERYIPTLNRKRYDVYLKLSGIPSVYHSIDFADYKGNKNGESFKRIKYYADNCHKKEMSHVNLYLYGSHATQKTTLGCNILKQAMRNGKRAKFILAGLLVDSFMKVQGYNVDEDSTQEIKELKAADIILIDDCWDSEKSLLWRNSPNKNLIISSWDTFLRDTISNKTQIIMTSNNSIDAISENYGVSLYELIDRNFQPILLSDNIKQFQKERISKVFDNL